MSIPILTTKLYSPPPRPNAIKRAHLIDVLNRGLHRKLTLVTAPAGFGKTSLISEWLVQSACPVAWVSLDEGDSDPIRFLSYVVAALQTIKPHIGEDVATSLHAPQPPAIDKLLTALLNDMATITEDFILVLDDYHVLDNPDIDKAVAFLIDYLPPQMHLVIVTREDPPLPLSRLRARGQMIELRASDLRFKTEEAVAFLNTVMGLNLSADDITTLETRTEGWVAGLQLAALSLQGQSDVQQFITAFTGDNRYIVDYLVDEVLLHQPESIRNFLLQTAVLDRLHGALCDAITGQTTGSAILEELERGNLFVIPLDDKRQWFRYHHLFVDVLRAHLKLENPEIVPTLHQRASDWYMQNSFVGDAVHHGFAAEDYRRVSRILELTWGDMDRTRQFAPWLKWIRRLPDEHIQVRPVLSVGYGWALLENGELELGEDRLRDAEKLLASPSADMIIHDEEEFEVLQASIANARAYLSQAYNDISATIDYSQQALDLLPEDDYLRRGVTESILGLALWQQGDVETAYKSFASSLANFEIAGNILFAITGIYVVSDMLLTLGRLRKALDTYHQALDLAQAQGDTPIQGTADLYLGLSELHYEKGDDDLSRDYLQKSEDLSETTGFPRYTYRWSFFQSRLNLANGDFDSALDMLDKAEDLFVRGPVPEMRPIPALRATIWIRQGKLTDADRWATKQSLSVDDDLSYPREYEHLTFARLLIAQKQYDDALKLLSRLLTAAEDGKRNGSVIDILIQQAVAYHAQGNISQAIPPLERALILAEPEGFVRIFADEGAPIADLLTKVSNKQISREYINTLQSVVSIDTDHQPKLLEANESLIEPLSERELEILHLLAEGLSNRQISERLYLALSTIKGHNRNIYGKLNVSRRTEAIARARELGLL